MLYAARSVALGLVLVAAFFVLMRAYLGIVEEAGGPWAAEHAVDFCGSWVLGLASGALAVLVPWFWRTSRATRTPVDAVLVLGLLCFLRAGTIGGLELAAAEVAGGPPAGLPLCFCPNWPVGLGSGAFAAGFAWWARRGEL